MIVMIVQHPSGFYHNQIARSVRELGVGCTLLSWMHFDARSLDAFSPERDIVFVRTGTNQALSIAREFERRGFLVLNDSRYINMSAQKVIANQYARANRIPIPELSVAIDKKHPQVLRDYLAEYGSLVAKPVYSRDMGRYVYRLSSDAPEQALDDFNAVPGTEVLVQSEILFERIVRAIVLGGKMVVEATTFDTKHAPDWKATVCMNPNAKHYQEVPEKLVQLAEWTCTAFGGDVAYIDYFEMADGEYVLSEINHSCGLQHHETITGVPIRKHIARYLVDRYQQHWAMRASPVKAAA
jgi:glutathione synthase/RimK-type ligase-like ATP-grasp enzyme